MPKRCPACQGERLRIQPPDGPGVLIYLARLLMNPHRTVVCLDCGIVLTYLIEAYLPERRRRSGLKSKASYNLDEI